MTSLALVLMAGAALSSTDCALPAFPGAEGAGRCAAGGRGGAVYTVTNLEDSGPGSLRAGVEAMGPRTIVFATGGTIQLKSPLVIANRAITIAGQTAPGGGVTLRDHPLVIDADDVVVRFIRSRLGSQSKTEADAIWVRGGRRIILDHVSASWSVDEALSASARYIDGKGVYDLTVQWSIIANSMAKSLHVKGDHGYGSLVRGGRGSRFSLHHNLWANHQARMPRPGNYDLPDKDPVGAFFDFRSNVFYNWGGQHSGYNADKGSLAAYNFVDNAYVSGPDSKGQIAFNESNLAAKAWFEGNLMDGREPADPWTLTNGVQAPGWRSAGPIPMPPVKRQPAAKAYESVLATAGASLSRDRVDTSIVDGVRGRTGRIVNTEADDGGWPVLEAGSAPADRDGDGMPDVWEGRNGLNPNKADGSAPSRGFGGYTPLEAYLAHAAKPRQARS